MAMGVAGVRVPMCRQRLGGRRYRGSPHQGQDPPSKKKWLRLLVASFERYTRYSLHFLITIFP
jgi:hypothetical protein